MKFKNWRDMVNAGKWRRKRLRPYYFHTNMKAALKRLHIPYRDFVLFYNGDQLQYLDFVVRYRGKTHVFLWRLFYRWHTSEKQRYLKKIEFLENRQVPYTIMPRDKSTADYQFLVIKALGLY